MIFADGAGATIIEKKDESFNHGILSHKTCTFSTENTFDLFLGDSFDSNNKSKDKYIKMYGHKIYEFAITKVPQALKDCLEASGKSVNDIKKIFLHQANEKMDDAMVDRFYKLYDLPRPENVMPMSIGKLGNSSVATIPTLFDLVKNNKIENHSLKKGDIVLFGSVGAGMNVNAITYQI
jgi:3-oxoacyl-[acyl-carrier-protein] synthase-3